MFAKMSLMAIAALISASAWSAEYSFTGRVLADNYPFPGSTIIVSDGFSKEATLSGMDGKFKIYFESEPRGTLLLTVRFQGTRTETRTIKLAPGKSQFEIGDILLIEDNKNDILKLSRDQFAALYKNDTNHIQAYYEHLRVVGRKRAISKSTPEYKMLKVIADKMYSDLRREIPKRTELQDHDDFSVEDVDITITPGKLRLTALSLNGLDYAYLMETDLVLTVTPRLLPSLQVSLNISASAVMDYKWKEIELLRDIQVKLNR